MIILCSFFSATSLPPKKPKRNSKSQLFICFTQFRDLFSLVSFWKEVAEKKEHRIMRPYAANRIRNICVNNNDRLNKDKLTCIHPIILWWYLSLDNSPVSMAEQLMALPVCCGKITSITWQPCPTPYGKPKREKQLPSSGIKFFSVI